MVEILEKITAILDASLDGVRVMPAYSHKVMQKPIYECSVYSTIDETQFSENVVRLKFYIYSPLQDDGICCLKTAEKVCVALSGLDEPGIMNINVSECEWNKYSKAFTCTVGCCVAGDEELIRSGNFNAIAWDFERDSVLELNFPVSNVKADKQFSPYPVMTYGEGKPKAVVCCDNNFSYIITLYGISRTVANILSENGKFALSVSRGNKSEKYTDCVCKNAEINLNSVNRANTLTLLSWNREELYGELD